MLGGRVRVNGEPALELGTRVVPGRDTVEVDGARVELAAPRWVAFHKPPGVLTTRRDPHGGRTIYDVLPDELSTLTYVGRLDRETEGLLLLTNDGDVAHGILHPSRQVERAYGVLVGGRVLEPTLEALRTGVDLDDGPARARSAQILEQDEVSTRLEIVLTEGRKREVRRMMQAIDHSVRRLVRLRFGPVELGDLEPGAWRDLTDHERDALRTLAEPTIGQ
jgi:23S rRNA pseudouridine2605 synthase